MKNIILLSMIFLFGCSSISEEKNESLWQHGFYIDDFGDATENGYISAECSGTFLNNLISSGDLIVKLILSTPLEKEDNFLQVRFFEYGSEPSVDFSSKNIYIEYKVKGEIISILDSIGKKPFLGYGDVFYIDLNYVEKFIDPSGVRLLCTVITDYSKDEYRFTFPFKGFKEAIDQYK
ncbi:hypothetical protein ES705_24549 [subsurface metagenome]